MARRKLSHMVLVSSLSRDSLMRDKKDREATEICTATHSEVKSR